MRMKMRTINKRGLLSFLLTLIMIIGVLPLSAPTVSAEDDTVEVSTWEELKRALEYTTSCSVVKVVADIETKDLNGHTGLHQDNIIFMTMAMDTGIKVNDSFPVQEKKQVKIFSPQPGKLLNHLIRNRLYDMDFSESRSCRSSKTKKIYMQSRYEKICFYFYFCIGICGICCRNG